MKRMKNRSGAEGLGVLAEEGLCGGGGVDDEDGEVAELDLVDGAVGKGPLAVFFGGVGGADGGDVAD